MFANHRREDGIYPLITIEITKHKREITKSILKNAKISKWIGVFNLLKT
jgi:hypothetical protein